jgi:hypothetical protein
MIDLNAVAVRKETRDGKSIIQRLLLFYNIV